MTAPVPPPLPSSEPSEPSEPLRFVCEACGAQTAYAPGTTTMRCPSCGYEQQIAASDESVEEHSYDDWARLPSKPIATIGNFVLHCQGCGAVTETDMIAGKCEFCAGVLVAVDNPDGIIVPEAILPFGIEKRAANDLFGKWVRTRWFAPSALKKVGSTEAIRGAYIPHWTFDAQTETDYAGQRGEHYYTTETHTVSDGKGGTRTETRTVQHTRWYPAAGHVARLFDDVVVSATVRLPERRLEQMGPWSTKAAVPYEPRYLAGYDALRYDIEPDVGLSHAKQKMEAVIADDCRHDIGGDEQRISSMRVGYYATMFKLMLLPMWLASYIYAGKTYQVFVNANTGEVVGDRPYSRWKIALAVIGAIVLAYLLFAVWSTMSERGSSSQ